MPVASDRLGDERYAPLKIRDNQGAVPGRLVFPGPQLIFTVPGPARPQSAVYQGDRVPGGLGCILFCWPVLFCCILDQWRQESDVSRYR